MENEYDVVVIGAGVVGSATARELARFDLKIVVLEAGLDIASGATRANSGIVHAGYDPEPGTLKAKYNVLGSALFDQWQRELGFGFYRNGALVLAFDEDERRVLEGLLERSVANGVEGVSIVEAEELRSAEPNVSPEAIAALNVETSGICDPYGFTYGIAENAAANGVEFAFDARVVDIERGDRGFVVKTQDGREISARAIVNCAGVHADEMNNLVSEHKITIQPVKGEYLLYHNSLAGTFRHTMFQVPSAGSKGVLVSPVLFGNIFCGPNATPTSDKDDIATTEEGQREVLERSKRTWPEAWTEKVITTYAGLRATDASGKGDFIIGEAPDVVGFFNAACIDSPGLTSAPAIAVDLARMVAERLGAEKNEAFDPVRIPAPLLAMMDKESRAKLVAQNPLFGENVCKCCDVSEGELVETLHRVLPVLSLDALKWRTGATMGPCHGGRCTARILSIMQRELGIVGTDVQKRMQGSNLVISDAAVDKGLADHCIDVARQARADLDEQGLREIGWGSLEIEGTRPAGIVSALQAIALMGVTGQLPGQSAAIWGTHDLALRAALTLADAGVAVKCVLETGPVAQGSSELVGELSKRGIAVQCEARVTSVSGLSRLESVTIEHNSVRETIECDLLVATPEIVAE